MEWLNEKDGFSDIDALGKKRNPFLFVISYDKQKIYAKPLDELDKDILYKIGKKQNYQHCQTPASSNLSIKAITFQKYKKKIDKVLANIRAGNTYLLNLTYKTEVKSKLSLEDIFRSSQAKFKLYIKDKFVCFSPENFVTIEENNISTYPMKGTIDSAIDNALDKILTDKKEMAEHVMIVDLMRNDLSQIAIDTQVDNFRYSEKIKAGEKELIQISSKITATLPDNWRDNIGQIFAKLLPCGSISGTPKRKTIEIIDTVEGYDRGFYTGVFGVFDGTNLYSSVMIRFIEKEGEKLYYKSGGGITADSDPKSEYQEMLEKIYLPF